jgi:hypothetical protein
VDAGSANSMTMDWLNGERATLEDKRKALLNKIEYAERDIYSAAAKDALTLGEQDQAFSAVQAIQQEIAKKDSEFEALKLDIADSAHFIASLQAKLGALRDANLVASELGEVDFQVCPACYAPIAKGGSIAPLACHLCKSPLDDDGAKGRIVAMSNDAAIQLKQSEHLQERRSEQVEAFRADISNLLTSR